MTKHCQIYLKYFEYVPDEYKPCECCLSSLVDVHHIQGRGKDKDVIKNLMGLCRDCHSKAHDEKISESELQYIHNNFMVGVRKTWIK